MTNNTENKALADSELVGFLEQEIQSCKKKTKMSVIFGGVILVVVFGYFSWLLSFVRNELLNPQALATVTVGIAEDNIPGYMAELEQEIKNQAPGVSKQVIDQIKSVFPAFRLMVQAEFEDSAKLLPVLRNETQDAVRTYVRDNASEIQKLFEAHQEKEFADRAIAASLTQFSEDLKANGLNLADFHISSLKTLSDLRDQMRVLAQKAPSQMTELELKKASVIVALLGELKGIGLE